MKYALDSSVALKWVLAEPDSDKAMRLRDDARAGIHELIAPDLFPIEVGHSMTRAERQGRVSISDGWAWWQMIMADAPLLHPYIPLMPRAYAISSSARIGMYDCLYVSLAEREACGFVTADDRLVKNLKPTYSFIVPLSSLP